MLASLVYNLSTSLGHHEDYLLTSPGFSLFVVALAVLAVHFGLLSEYCFHIY